MYPSTREPDILFCAPNVDYPPRHKNPAFMAIAFFVIVGSGYILLNSSSIFMTPRLEVDRPQDGAHVSGFEVDVKGTTDPKARVTINSYEVLSDEKGSFAVTLPLQQGYHILDVRVKNRVGRESKVVRRIVVE